MSKLVSAFECIIGNEVMPLAEVDRQEAYAVLAKETLADFLEYLFQKEVIDDNVKAFLSVDMYLYEINEKGHYLSYCVEDFDKRTKLVKKVFDGQVDKYAENYEG